VVHVAGRIIKEIVTFPVFLLVVIMTPILAIGIKSFNNELKENHKKVLSALQKEKELKRLLDYALTLGIKFSIHNKKLKNLMMWYVLHNSPRPKGTTLLARYVDFLSTFDETIKQPVVYVHMDRKNNLLPPDKMQLFKFLSHELGHIRNGNTKLDRCSSKRRNPCFRDELFATLEGEQILKELGYDFDYPALRRRWAEDEIRSIRCIACVEDEQCRTALDDLLTITQKDNAYTLNLEKLLRFEHHT